MPKKLLILSNNEDFQSKNLDFLQIKNKTIKGKQFEGSNT